MSYLVIGKANFPIPSSFELMLFTRFVNQLPIYLYINPFFI